MATIDFIPERWRVSYKIDEKRETKEFSNGTSANKFATQYDGKVKKIPSRYRARYRTPDYKSRSKNFARKCDAEAFLTAIEHSKLSGAYVDRLAGKQLFANLWETRQELLKHSLRPSTFARDSQFGARYIIPAFGRLSLAQIDRARIESWVAELSGVGLAPATVVKAFQLFNRTMRAAVENGLIAVNPAERIALPKIESEEMRFLTPPEVASLADAIDGDNSNKYRTLVLLGAYGGLRLGELLALRREKIDLLRGRIDVCENVYYASGKHHVGPPKTRAGRRSVPLPRSIVNAIEPFVTSVDSNELLFPATTGGYMHASLFRRQHWIPAIKRAGLAPLRIHDLRHTAVAFWIAANASPKEVAARAGHASVVTVLDRYGHLLPGSEDRVNDALDALFASSKPAVSAPVIALPKP